MALNTENTVDLEKYSDNGRHVFASSRKKEMFMEEVTPHLDLLSKMAWFLVGSMQDVDDLVQDTLLNAFRSFHTFQPGSNCRAWLNRIMKNIHIDRIRRHARAMKTIPVSEFDRFKFAYEESLKQELNSPEHRVLANVLPECLEEALDALPDTFRTALTLHKLDGLSYEEVAEKMDCPLGTVRSRIIRARRKMKWMLQGELSCNFA